MQKKNRKLVSFCSLATLVISSSVVSTTGVKAADNTTQRLGGTDRYETASLVSQEGWEGGSDYVVIANGQSYADNLTAAPLAKAKDAPILLTQSNNLDSTTLEEIKRLGAKHFIIVGGDGVVSQGVENKIKSEVASSDVERYGGADRFETSVKVAEAIGDSDSIFVANGLRFPDALSAAPIAAIEGSPIILTQDSELPVSVSDYIKSKSGITKSYVAGGDGVVSDSVLNSLPGGERLGGTDRYETNSKVIREFADELDFSNIFVARGDEFPDSLTGSVLAAKQKSAVVITAQSASSYTEGLFKDLLDKNTKIIALGGSAVLPDSVISQLKDAIEDSTTPGGGGGSSSSGDNITGDITKYYGPKIEDAIANDPTLSKYYNVDTSNGITLTVKDSYKDKITNVKDIFNNSDNAEVGDINTPGTIAYRVQKLYDLASEHVNAAKIDGKTFKEFLIAEKAKDSKLSQYIKTDGTIDVQLVAEKIDRNEIDYDDYDAFITNLSSAIKDSVNLSNPSPEIDIKNTSLSINKILQDSKTIYDSDLSREKNIDNILDIQDTVGKFKVYVDDGDAYFYITIK